MSFHFEKQVRSFNTGQAIRIAVLLAGLVIASPAAAHCKGKHDPDLNGGACPPHDDGGVGSDVDAQGVVGHIFTDPLPCDNPPGAHTGDFYDRGTENGCEILTCTANNNSVVCGTQSHPKPQIDISALFDIWEPGGGDPATCFGSGVIATPVHTADTGGSSAIRLLFFFTGDPDPLLRGCSGADADISYVAELPDCQVEQGPYPPASGAGETVVICNANSQVEIKTEGGGRVAKKCGCTANGLLGSNTRLRFRVNDP